MKQTINKFKVTVIAALLFQMLSCAEEEEKVKELIRVDVDINNPLLTTAEISLSISGSATQGQILTVYGIEPGLTEQSANKVLSDYTSQGSAVVTLTGLTPKTTYYVKVFITSENDAVASPESSFETLEPKLLHISRKSARRGEIVDLEGSFSSNAADNVVKFGDIQAEVVSVDEIGAKVKVPSDLPLGQIVQVSAIVGGVPAVLHNALSMPFMAHDIAFSNITPESVFEGDESQVQLSVTGSTINMIGDGINLGTTNVSFDRLDQSSESFQMSFSVPKDLTPGEYPLSIVILSENSFFGRIALDQNLIVQQSPWVKMGDFDDVARESAISFSIGAKAYVGLGLSSNGFQKDFWEYDPSTNTWTKKADFPADAREGAVGFSIGEKGYVGLGKGDSNLNDFWEYDPATNAWTSRSDFQGTPRSGATAIVVGGNAYVGLGRDANGLKSDWWEYNPETNTWTSKADFPGEARESASAFSIGGKGYVGLGNKNSLIVLGDIWEFDPITNTWIQKANFGGSPRSSAVAYVINEKGYVGTGFNSAIDGTNDFWRYDPMTNEWTKDVMLKDVGRFGAMGFAVGEKGYVVSGTTGGTVFLTDMWEFNP